MDLSIRSAREGEKAMMPYGNTHDLHEPTAEEWSRELIIEPLLRLFFISLPPGGGKNVLKVPGRNSATGFGSKKTVRTETKNLVYGRLNSERRSNT